jgi:hypothetical protein
MKILLFSDIHYSLDRTIPNFEDHRFLDAPSIPPAYGVVVVDIHYVTVHVIEFGYSSAIVASG